MLALELRMRYSGKKLDQRFTTDEPFCCITMVLAAMLIHWTQENAYENVVCQMAAILSRPLSVNKLVGLMDAVFQ